MLKNNIGIDLTLFKERLVLSFDYFRNTTKDQLMSIPLPASTGAENITVNFGENQNTGYDFSVAAQIIRSRNWAWTSVINGSHVKDLHQAHQQYAEEHLLPGRSGQPADAAVPGGRFAV